MDSIFVLLFLLWVFTEYALIDWKKKNLRNKLCFIPALIALGTAAYGLYEADQQKKKAAKLRARNLVPPSINELEANNRLASNSTVSPGYARGLEKLGQSTSTAVQNARLIGGSAGQVQQAAGDADARQKEATKDLMVNNEQYRLAARQDLNRTLQIKGGYEKEASDELAAAKSALTGAAKQNTYNAITGLAEGAVNEYYDAQGKKAAKTPAAGTAQGTTPAPSFSGSRADTRATADDEIADIRAKGLILTPAQEAKIRKKYAPPGTDYVNPYSISRAPRY